MIKRHHLIFGPGGNSESFYAQGHKRTVETFAWQKQFGLKAFEYSFGRGINISESTARGIGQAAKASGVTLSVHAPYYINLASNVPETRKKSIEYIRNSARLLNLMGGKRLVVHPGSPLRQRREEALARCAQALVQARTALIEDAQAAVSLARAAMGMPRQVGTLQEILDFVLLDLSFLPCIDFAHLHAASGGSLGEEKDFADVLDQVETRLGPERSKRMHIHFSKVEYGPKGELRHRVFSDEGFGPDFAPLARLLVQRDYRATIICESRGTMAEDAAQMLRMADTVLPD